MSSPVAFLFSVVRQLPGWPWGGAGQAEKGGSCSCRAVSQDMGEARALACPGQGQETGGFAEAQTGRSVERPLSRCRKATRREAGMGGALLSLSWGGQRLSAECCFCLGQDEQTDPHHLPLLRYRVGNCYVRCQSWELSLLQQPGCLGQSVALHQGF